MIDVIFIALAFLAISGAIAMITYANPMYSALGVLISMLSVAGMFALLNATFLFLVQIIVYAGAIMTLILFILMFLMLDRSWLNFSIDPSIEHLICGQVSNVHQPLSRPILLVHIS